MPTSDRTAANRSLLGSLLFWIVVLSLYSSWTWTSEINDYGGDSAMYLLTAQHWSPLGSHNAAAAHFASMSIFPPLYPLLLALFSAGDKWLIAHQITAFCGVAALFLCWKWLRISEFPMLESLAAIVLLATIPGFYLQALYIHSEFLFILFVALCIYAICLLERDGKGIHVVIAALAALGAYLTRSAGIALVAALIVYFVLNRPRREWPTVVTLTMAPVFAWMLLGQNSSSYFSYWSMQLSAVASGGITDFLAGQIAWISDGFGQNLNGPGSGNTSAVYFLAAGCGVAWLIRLWQRKIDALFLGAYFAILVIWPYPAERMRYLFPVIPILLVELLLVIHSLGWQSPRWNARIASRLTMLVIAITLLPNLILTLQRRFEPLPASLESLRQSPEWFGPGSRDERLAAVFQSLSRRSSYQKIAAHVPEADCVYATKAPVAAILSGRMSLNTPLPDSSLGMKLDPDAAACRYVYMETFNSPTYAEHFYPLSRWEADLQLLQATYMLDGSEEKILMGLIAEIK